jgi:thioredoxin reductase (NADPH)
MKIQASSALVERRREQMFPILSPTQIATARRFGGEVRHFAPEEIVFDVGQVGTPAHLVIAGSIEVTRRDALGHRSTMTRHGPGELTGEVSQLAGGPSLVHGRAGSDGAEAVPFDAVHLRNLVIGTTEIGETIMRAFILRRAFLIDVGARPVLLGRSDSGDVMRLQNFLRRNGMPYTVVDPDADRDASHLIQQMGLTKAELPIAICPDGTMLRNPGEKALAQRLHLLPPHMGDRSYDVAVVGAGPAGLATAVYAASEGLSVLVLDLRAIGGQAGASARIENYLGFPTGISGDALAGRAYTQAQKFGAIIAIPTEVRLLRATTNGGYELELDEGVPVRASVVVIASGARYRKLCLPNLDDFEGRGVYYWASPIEATLCERREVVVVGGGNSAGQATVFLASHVANVHLLVRSGSLGGGMSQYLVDRIEAQPNVIVHTETQLTRLIGDPLEGLQAVCWRDQRTSTEERRPIRYVFLFIGAVPTTEWLRRCAVSVDDKGFVRTGTNCQPGAPMRSVPEHRSLPLETSRRGVFAVGDVRAGSVKRLSAAVGEGAAAVAQIHAYLQAIPPPHTAD